MRQLPPQFLLVNAEGIFRCYTTFEEVAGLDHLLAKYAQHKFVVLKNVAACPYGLMHLAIHTKEGMPVLVLEAFLGKMKINTQYRSHQSGDHGNWISPRFFAADNTFEMCCEFDFNIWRIAGFRFFFAINLFEHYLNMWVEFNGQNYRPPLGNVFEDGRICTGNSHLDYDKHFVITQGEWIKSLTGLVEDLGESNWNGDAIHSSLVTHISRLVRFDPNTLEMLPPLSPEKNIANLGINANPTLAEITKLLI